MTRVALCIGINYQGTEDELGGCLNDAADWKAALEERGFVARTLLEADATRQRMLSAIEATLHEASNDLCVITYSGHGTFMADDDGDEPDGRDEVWCPVDCSAGAYVTDDEIYDLLNRSPQTSAVVITDSCFNGTITKAAYRALRTSQARSPRFLSPTKIFPPEVALAALQSKAHPSTIAKPDLALGLSAARDDEYSWDASFDDRPNGAFSYYAIRALRQLPEGADYRAWLRMIWENLPSADFPQTPTIVGTFRQQHRAVFT
jgi:hypothetical protein